MTNWLDVDEVRAYLAKDPWKKRGAPSDEFVRLAVKDAIIRAIAALPEPREHTHLHPDWCRDDACKSYLLRRIWLVARAVVGEET